MLLTGLLGSSVGAIIIGVSLGAAGISVGISTGAAGWEQADKISEKSTRITMTRVRIGSSWF
jgi:hypothetical protein